MASIKNQKITLPWKASKSGISCSLAALKNRPSRRIFSNDERPLDASDLSLCLAFTTWLMPYNTLCPPPRFHFKLTLRTVHCPGHLGSLLVRIYIYEQSVNNCSNGQREYLDQLSISSITHLPHSFHSYIFFATHNSPC